MWICILNIFIIENCFFFLIFKLDSKVNCIVFNNYMCSVYNKLLLKILFNSEWVGLKDLY